MALQLIIFQYEVYEKVVVYLKKEDSEKMSIEKDENDEWVVRIMITTPIIILKAFGFLGTKLNLMSANVFKIKNFVCVNNKEIREKLNHFCGVVDLP